MRARWLTNGGILDTQFKIVAVVGICWIGLNIGLTLFLFNKTEYYNKLQLYSQTIHTQGEVFHKLLTSSVSDQGAATENGQAYVRLLKAISKGGISANDPAFLIDPLPQHIASQAEELILQVQQAALPQNEFTQRNLLQNNALMKQSIALYCDASKETFHWALLGMGGINILGLLLLCYYIRQQYIMRINLLAVLAKGATADLHTERFTTLSDEISTTATGIESLLNEVQAASLFIEKVGKGDLSLTLAQNSEHLATQALFEALKTMQQRLIQVASDDHQRNWSIQGLAKFVDILRSSNDDLTALSDKILSELVRYTSSNQGVLFFAEKDEQDKTVLRQYASFAFDRKKWHEQQINPGEGLIGQCYLEKISWYLTDVPKAYINITSGLGDCPPSALLIVPLMVNGEVMGIVELAGFHLYEDYQIKFVEKLGENIAATIANVRTTVQTKQLLEETQQMAEILRAQEEEVRQNMEELEATQEELHRKMQDGERLQQELTARMSALDASALMSESDVYGNITYVNDRFCEVAKYRREEVMGKPHNILRHPDNSKELFKEMWSTIKAGKTFKGRYPNKAKDGSTYWVDATIVPVLGDDGKPVKYIGLRFDITEQIQSGQEITKLLHEANDKTNELQAQEEELRQNMEEMQSIQEELERRMQEGEKLRTELDARMKALDTTALLSESDLFGNITYVNTKFCEVAKYKPEEVLGKPHNILRHPDNSKELFKEMWSTIKAGKIFTGRYPNRAKDGSTYWVDATIVPVMGDDGKPCKFIGIRFDVTDHINKDQESHEHYQQILAQEEELRQNMEEMQAIQEELHRKVMQNQEIQSQLDSRIAALDAAAIVSETDLYGTISYVNSKFCEVSKYTQEEVLGKPHNILRHPDVPKEVFASLWTTIKAGKVFKARYPNRAKDGSVYWVDATLVPVMDQHGKPQKYIGIRFLIEREEDQVIQIFQGKTKESQPAIR